jgi:hypothetical protein
MMIRQIFKTTTIVLLVLAGCSTAFSWGSTAHKLINLKAVQHLPASMSRLKADSLFYQSHASDADNRKVSGDTAFYNESERHYIDIDSYPDFQHLPHSRDAVVHLYGWETVKNTGTLPWATIMVMDSLTAQIARGDYAAADQSMSDLGHYVGDGHQPLHCTENYDGWATNNGGIHSRYETGMINAYKTSLTVTPDSVTYVSSPIDYVFAYILQANTLVDSILKGDTYAKSVSGYSGSGTVPASYYTALWEKTGSMTQQRIQLATVALASLWYTAWVNAQAPEGVHEPVAQVPEGFELRQNYPNPFNPNTAVSFELGALSSVSLRVYDILGREVATLVEGRMEAGEHTVRWNATGQAGGVYFYRLDAEGYRAARKMVLIK